MLALHANGNKRWFLIKGESIKVKWKGGLIMGIIISVGLQKGGVGKSTTTAITAYLLSKKNKVLAVDFDSQGNLSQMLTQKNIYDFAEKTILEACLNLDPVPYIYEIHDNLHILPAEDRLAILSRYIHRDKHPFSVLRKTLSKVKEEYDFILVDLPPNLGDQTLNGLIASDYAVVILQSDPFALDALDRYLETLQLAQQYNPDLRLAGILTTMINSRASLDAAILQKARNDYEDLVFKSVIKRRSRIKEFSLEGIQDRTKADREALEQYRAFTEELIGRVV
jgi:chromosome partitioning protein